MPKQLPFELIFQIFALLISFIIVHGAYVTVVRPQAESFMATEQALLAKDVPQHHRARRRVPPCRKPQLAQSRIHLGVAAAWLARSREVALHVGGEDWDSGTREGLGKCLKRHGLACPRGTGHKPVAVGHVGQQHDLIDGVLGNEQRIGHGDS